MFVDTDRWNRYLATNDGRDKLLRLANYVLLFSTRRTSDETTGKILSAVAQISSARNILRRLGDLPMWKALIGHLRNGPQTDLPTYLLDGLTLLLYTCYFPVEHVSWLTGLDILPFNGQKWGVACIVIWATAISTSILRTFRAIYCTARDLSNAKKGGESGDIKNLSKQLQTHRLTLLTHCCELAVAVNFLPPGILWSSTLPLWKVGGFGTVSTTLMLLASYARCT